MGDGFTKQIVKVYVMLSVILKPPIHHFSTVKLNSLDTRRRMTSSLTVIVK